MVILKKITTRVGEDMKKLRPSHIAGGNVKGGNHLKNQFVSSSNN